MLDRNYLLSYAFPTAARIAGSRRTPDRVAALVLAPFAELIRDLDSTRDA